MKRDEKLKLGITSYSLRKFSRPDAIAMTGRLGLKYIALKDFHLPLEAAAAEIEASAEKVAQAGIKLMGCGVVYMPADEAYVRQVFEYAKTGGMPVIVASPDLDALDICNRMVGEYDIKIAIHNHGPGDNKYPLPSDAYNLVKDMDRRMGVCPDIGHTVRLGADAVEEIERVSDRMHDLHIKDVDAAVEEGKTCEVGRGVVDIAKILTTLLGLNYDGHVALEYEKDPDDPLAGMAESIGYIRGVLSVIM